MLVGLPGSGKSTWRKTQSLNRIVLSTDAYIEDVAVQAGKSYNDVFAATIGLAEKHMEERLNYAVEHNLEIIWDQTNLTAKSRKRKLDKLPAHYKRHAVVFDVAIEELEECNRQRETVGRAIPWKIFNSMCKTLEKPTISEGFHSITDVQRI